MEADGRQICLFVGGGDFVFEVGGMGREYTGRTGELY